MVYNYAVPVRAHIDRNVLSLEAAGQYTRQELADAFVEALQQPGASSLVGVLLDLRASTSMVTRTATELHETAAYYATYKDRIGGRVAILTASAATYGLGRMASVTAEHLGLSVFVCREEPEAWAFLLT